MVFSACVAESFELNADEWYFVCRSLLELHGVRSHTTLEGSEIQHFLRDKEAEMRVYEGYLQNVRSNVCDSFSFNS